MTHEDLRSLEEQIAERLYQSVPRHLRADFRPYSSIGNEAREQFLSYAREAVRLMRWTRHEAAREVREATGSKIGEAYSKVADNEHDPLTLPPAGWEP